MTYVLQVRKRTEPDIWVTIQDYDKPLTKEEFEYRIALSFYYPIPNKLHSLDALEFRFAKLEPEVLFTHQTPIYEASK